MPSIKKFWCAVAAVAVSALVTACETPPKPTQAAYNITATADLNPDADGRASPVVFRIYELKSSGIFESADFFALYDNEAATLGQELVGRKEYQIQPSESRSMTEKLQPATRMIGVIAAYRELDMAKWRAVVPIQENATTPIDITLGKLTVDMKVAEQ